ncbi:MAG: hypothetical protein IPM42_21940 [Saprospiraceae bacterium]|nr:hypothetical protein [Saprospiraceae bacterium]
MTESSQKIRTDFLKSLGIMEPCPCDFDFLSPLTDNQILKTLVKKTIERGESTGILAHRYKLHGQVIKNIKVGMKKSSIFIPKEVCR